jgi:hypothetical protein
VKASIGLVPRVWRRRRRCDSVRGGTRHDGWGGADRADSGLVEQPGNQVVDDRGQLGALVESARARPSAESTARCASIRSDLSLPRRWCGWAARHRSPQAPRWPPHGPAPPRSCECPRSRATPRTRGMLNDPGQRLGVASTVVGDRHLMELPMGVHPNDCIHHFSPTWSLAGCPSLWATVNVGTGLGKGHRSGTSVRGHAFRRTCF